MATYLRKKVTANITQRTAQTHTKSATANGFCDSDPYDFDIGLTGNGLSTAMLGLIDQRVRGTLDSIYSSLSSALPCADHDSLTSQTASEDEYDPASNLKASHTAQEVETNTEKSVPESPSVKQHTAQHEPAFLQRLMVKQDTHAVSWSAKSSSSSDWGDTAEDGSAEVSAQPVQLDTSEQPCDSAAAAAPSDKPTPTMPCAEHSQKALQPSETGQEEQAQAAKPLRPSGGSQNSDRQSKGPVLKRPASAGALAGSQGSAGSRKRKAGPSNAMVRSVLLGSQDLIPVLLKSIGCTPKPTIVA